MIRGHAMGRSATLFGIGAIVLWSAMVGLIRMVSESFGPTLGVALIYSLAAIGLWATRRPRSLRGGSVAYLVIGGGLFVFYEAAVGLSLGLASSATQAIQVGVVNYLWPTFTVLLSTILRRGRGVSWLIFPAVLLGVFGTAWVVGGPRSLDPAGIVANVAQNPAPYLLALTGAIAWASYNVCVPRLGQGQDGIAVFITCVAVVLWLIGATTGSLSQLVSPTCQGVIALVSAAVVISAGYACWDVGLLRGNITVLAAASYMTPVLSSAVAAVLLGVALPVSFWEGVVLVVTGSLLSWFALRGRRSADAHRVVAAKSATSVGDSDRV